MSRTLLLIRDELELEGFVPGTPDFEKHLLARKVQKCQEMQSVRDCPECKAFMDCRLAQGFMMLQKFGGTK